MDIQIHIARDADASAISETIIKTLRESNARDYSSEIIDRVIESFSPSKILRLLAERQVLVATLDSQIVATASLDRDVVRSVFIDPSFQGMGIGRQLMERIQSLAIDAGFNLLRVPSSVTAEGFYASLASRRSEMNFIRQSARSSWLRR